MSGMKNRIRGSINITINQDTPKIIKPISKLNNFEEQKQSEVINSPDFNKSIQLKTQPFESDRFTEKYEELE